MQDILITVNSLLSGGIIIALATAFIWGIFSVILSPCHLTSIPLVIGYITSHNKNLKNKKAFVISIMFSVGILASIILVGAITISMGRLFGDVGILSDLVVIGIFLIFGLYLLDVNVFKFIPLNIDLKTRFKNSPALILGIIFGVSLGPCTFAYIAPILGFTFKISTVDLFRSIALLTFFAAGHCITIALAGVSGNAVNKYLQRTNSGNALKYFQKFLGILFIGIGLYFIFNI